MRYTLSNTINKPLEEVIAKFHDEEGVKHWMEGLQKIVPISGEKGKAGYRSDFYFLYRGKEMKIEETILEVKGSNQIKFAYRSPMGYNEVEMIFEEISEKKVEQINNSYFEMKGFKKIMGILFKGMFKKQSMKYMNAFKAYVENEKTA